MQATGGAALTTNESLTGASAVDGVDTRPSRRFALTLLGSIAAVVIAADVVTKDLAVSHLAGHRSVRILGGAVYLLLTRNSGAAFSIGTGYTFVFPIVAVVVIGWILWISRRLRALPWALSLGLVLGGTIGNFADRLFRSPGPFVGHVVDFISVLDPYGQGFPVFNLADSALCVGVGLAVLLELTGRGRDGLRVAKQGASPTGQGAGGGMPDSQGDGV
jgi:signal peptidase II